MLNWLKSSLAIMAVGHRVIAKCFQVFGTPLLVCALFFSVVSCRGGVSSSPPIHFNPNMDNQARFDPQEKNTFFGDQRAMRPLVNGTIARGFLKNNESLHAGKKDNAYITSLPSEIHLNESLLKLGQSKYNIYCAPCHGYTGTGRGMVTQYSRAINPANLHDELRRSMAPGNIYEVIAQGKQSGGKLAMPAYGSQLNVRERWAVVAYVRALQLTRQAIVTDKGQNQ